MARRKFQRPLGERRYRRLFVIAVEGTKTEPQYFSIFNNDESVIHVNCLKSKHGAPLQVLKRMTDYLEREGLRKSDQAWLVVDKDQWTADQLTRLYQWSQEDAKRGLALSNPCFEYWLLLHFEDGAGIAGSKRCIERLKRYLAGYNKDVDTSKFTQASIEAAVLRAKQRDNPPCADWPRAKGSTTVYRLVENILGMN